MKLSINVMSAESVQRAIDAVHQKQVDLQSVKLKELIRKVAELGALTARSIYGPEVTVTVEEENNGYRQRIVAEGRPVAFFEFGAGIYTDPGHAFAGNAASQGLYVYDGSYSEEHARQYVNWGYWIFGGKKIYGVQPRYALWSAEQDMAADLAEVAREVFNDRH